MGSKPKKPKSPSPEKKSIRDQFLRRIQGEAVEIAATTDELKLAMADLVIEEMNSAIALQAMQQQHQILDALRHQIVAEIQMRASE